MNNKKLLHSLKSIIMKKIFLLVSIIATSFSCKKTEVIQPTVSESNIVSSWKLVEVYADPGDGSGKYQPVNSEKQLIFQKDGIVKSNYMFCAVGDASFTKKESYAIYDDTKRTITYDTCLSKKVNPESLPYTYLNDTILELTHFCIEGCGERYLKINQK